MILVNALREFPQLYRLTQTRLRDYTATLPEPQRAVLPRSWMNTDAELTAKPHAPLIAEFFGIADPETITEAFVASILMEGHCCAQDARIDGHSPLPAPMSESLSNLLLAESLARFGALSGDARALAPHVQRAFADLADGYAAEGRVATKPEFFRSVTNRAAPFHILVAALGLHAQQPERIETCSQMARHLLFWFQLLDDLQDWPKDLQHGRQSYLLHRLTPFVGDRPFAEWSAPDVKEALYLLGGAESITDEAVAHLESALALAEGQTLVRWIRALISHHRQARRSCIERKRDFLKTA